ncbi:MAG: HlyC/CorC family transporter [Calditrichae bacterium]|nr:HlyC/CorC family transporter [Calditrichota bacterium]MCB9059167.1 HlyC/CorC family transporter [Calditrichia bacterium]
MDPLSFIDFFSFFFFIILSAIFITLKTSFFSLNTSTIQSFATSTKSSEKQIAQLLKEQRRLLLTVITGNTISIAFAVVFALEIGISLIALWGINFTFAVLLAVALFFLFYITISEFLAKFVGAKYPKKTAQFTIYPLLVFYYVLLPVTLLLDRASQILSSSMGLDKDKHDLSEEELRQIVDFADDGAALRKDEKDMIHSIFEMSETVAREIMVPRTDMICVDGKVSITHLLKINKEKNHSRIPVYKDSIDNITGILHIKDLLPLIKRRTFSDFDITKITNPPYFVPEQKKINELLREFRTERIHMAIVVDEYGGTAGIVTLEDVIEEIVGEIQDEHDQETPQISKIDDNTFLVSGSILIDDLNDMHGFKLPEEEGIDTLAGFLLGQFGSVPKTKSTIRWNDLEFTVERVYRRRIERVRIIKAQRSEKVEE